MKCSLLKHNYLSELYGSVYIYVCVCWERCGGMHMCIYMYAFICSCKYACAYIHIQLKHVCMGAIWLLQKFKVEEREVHMALLSGDPHDQLNIAYHLIIDNKRLANESEYLCMKLSRYCCLLSVMRRGLKKWFTNKPLTHSLS